MTIKRELTAVKKKITAIGLKVEKLIAAVEKGETKVAKPSKAKAVKATAKKAPAKKKAGRVTDTDKVLNIIKRSKKGVDTATLVKKTGFDQKKIRNIVFRASKQGKIQRAEKGIYVGA
jgi:hypothetical protein